MDIGPQTRDQFSRLSRMWKQGEHVVVSGDTGSGKTMLIRHLDQIRIDRGGYVIVFVAKLTPDRTILKDYKGWTRWDSTDPKVIQRKIRRPMRGENRVLLWPDLSKIKGIRNKRLTQIEIFAAAMDALCDVGKWTLHIDEGLYMCDPKFLNLSGDIAMLHAMGRSGGLTIVTATQRPAHIPLIIYGSASHAFVGRTRVEADNKRLSELGGRNTARELSARINSQGRHDFLWVPVATDGEPETVNLAR